MMNLKKSLETKWNTKIKQQQQTLQQLLYTKATLESRLESVGDQIQQTVSKINTYQEELKELKGMNVVDENIEKLKKRAMEEAKKIEEKKKN